MATQRSYASLAVSLTTSTRNFGKGLNKASKHLDKFAGQVAKVGKGLALFGTAAAAGAAAGLTLITRNAMKATDQLAKVADRIGITTEALQAFNLAAQLGGSSVENVQRALEKLNMRLSEASTGKGMAVGALEMLGLSPDELKQAGTEEAFLRIADAMQNMASQADRVRIANDLFGRSGIEMVNMLSEGRESVMAVRREMEELGIAVTRVDAAKIEAANDSFTKVKATVQGLGTAIATEIAPYLTAVVNTTLDWVKEMGGVDKVVRSAFEWIKGWVHTIAVAFDQVDIFIKRMQMGTKILQARAAKAAGEYAKWAKLMKDVQRLQTDIRLTERGAIGAGADVLSVMGEIETKAKDAAQAIADRAKARREQSAMYVAAVDDEVAAEEEKTAEIEKQRRYSALGVQAAERGTVGAITAERQARANMASLPALQQQNNALQAQLLNNSREMIQIINGMAVKLELR